MECDYLGMARQEFYRRNLPHLDLPWARFFITFCTKDGRRLLEWQRGVVLEVVRECEFITLHQAVVMEDHVHLILNAIETDVGAFPSLAAVCKTLKGRSARAINSLLGVKNSSVWQKESFDRAIRTDEEYNHIWNYISMNPVNAGLSRASGEYPYYWDRSLR